MKIGENVLSVEWATDDEVRFPEEQYMCLYGDTIVNTRSNIGIQVIGQSRVGKTTTAYLVEKNSGRKFVVAREDRTILRRSYNTIHSELGGEYEGFSISRLVNFKGRAGKPHDGLSASLLYCMSVMGLPSIDFRRVEDNTEQTAIDFIALLSQISS